MTKRGITKRKRKRKPVRVSLSGGLFVLIAESFKQTAEIVRILADLVYRLTALASRTAIELYEIHKTER